MGSYNESKNTRTYQGVADCRLLTGMFKNDERAENVDKDFHKIIVNQVNANLFVDMRGTGKIKNDKSRNALKKIQQ